MAAPAEGGQRDREMLQCRTATEQQVAPAGVYLRQVAIVIRVKVHGFVAYPPQPGL